MGFATQGVGQRSESWLDHKTTLVWMGRRAFGRRGHRLLGVFAAGFVLVGASLFSAHAYIASSIGTRATSALERRLGRGVSVGEVDVGFSSIAIHDIEIEGVGSIERVVADYELSSLFSGVLDVGRVDAYGVELEVRRDQAGVLSIADILDRVRARETSGGKQRSSRVNMAGAPVEFHDLSVALIDEVTGTELRLEAAHLLPDRESGTLEVAGGGLEGRSAHPRLAALLDGNKLSSTNGSISVDGGALLVNLAGGFFGSVDERWKVVGKLERSLEAALHIETENVVLGRLLDKARSRGLLVDTERTAITTSVDLEVSPATLSASGSISMSQLGLAHRYVASSPVRDIELSANGSLRLDRAARSLEVSGVASMGKGVEYTIKLATQLADEARVEHPAATLSATLSVPSVECQDLLESIPTGLVPDLQGFELEGKMAATVKLAIDWANLEETVFDSDVLGSEGINNCRVVSAPERVSADRLRGSFEHTVPVGDTTMTFTVGPESTSYVPLNKVSRNLTRSLMTTEDSRFYRHKGFITKEFRTALIKNLEKKRFAYGASSISMQVVKNVMLARTKTVSRKLEELFLTWYIERELSKDRILEIYVNAIEFGPGIYGIKPAAKRYFGKHPRRLNPVESAFFSSILPAPVRRFKQYCRGWAGRWTKGKIDRILDIMLERNRLDPEQYLRAIDTPLIFRGRRNEICRQYEKGLIGAVADAASKSSNDVKKGTSL